MRNDHLEVYAGNFKLVFENEILKNLWEEELTGQISDGMWENTANSAWQFWCSVETEVGNKNEFITSQNYFSEFPYNIKTNFGFTRLIPYVGDRMVDMGKKYDPEYNEKKLRKDLQTISKLLKSQIVSKKIA